MSKFCEKCGKPINEGAMFCGFCGSVIPQDTGEDRSELVVSLKKDKEKASFVNDKTRKVLLILSVIMTSIGTAVIYISSALRNNIVRYNTVIEVQNEFDEMRKRINPYYDPETYRSQQRLQENLPYDIAKYIGIGFLALGIILLIVFIVNTVRKKQNENCARETFDNNMSSDKTNKKHATENQTQTESSSKTVAQIIGVIIGILIAIAGLYFMFDGFR